VSQEGVVVADVRGWAGVGDWAGEVMCQVVAHLTLQDRLGLHGVWLERDGGLAVLHVVYGHPDWRERLGYRVEMDLCAEVGAVGSRAWWDLVQLEARHIVEEMQVPVAGVATLDPERGCVLWWGAAPPWPSWPTTHWSSPEAVARPA
jgi:hypothetical protein